MKDGVKTRYTLEFKQEGVRLVRGGETVSTANRLIGMPVQLLDNWLKAEAAGVLPDVLDKTLTAEQVEMARLKAELSRVRMVSNGRIAISKRKGNLSNRWQHNYVARG